MISFELRSMRMPPDRLLFRQPAGSSVAPKADTYRILPSRNAIPFRWHRSSGANAVTNDGCQRGTKLYVSLRLAKHEKRVFTNQSSENPVPLFSDPRLESFETQASS